MSYGFSIKHEFGLHLESFLLQISAKLFLISSMVDKIVEKEIFGWDVHGFQGDLRMGFIRSLGVLRMGFKEYH